MKYKIIFLNITITLIVVLIIIIVFKNKFGDYESYKNVRKGYLEEKKSQEMYKIYEQCAYNKKCPYGYSSIKIDSLNIPAVYYTDRVLFYTNNIISDCPNIPTFIEKCGKSTIIHEKFFQVLKELTNADFNSCSWKPPVIFRYVSREELVKYCGYNASGCSAGKIIYSTDDQWNDDFDITFNGKIERYNDIRGQCYSFHHELVHSFLDCLNFDWSRFEYDLNHVFTFPIQTFVYQYVPECHDIYKSQIEAYKEGFIILENNKPNPPLSGWVFGNSTKNSNCQTMSFYIIYDEILNKQNSKFIKQITNQMKNKKIENNTELARLIYYGSGKNYQVLDSFKDANCEFKI